MNGYNPKYFNKNLLESMKSSLRDVIINEQNMPIRSPGAKKGTYTYEPPLGYDESGDFFRKGYADATRVNPKTGQPAQFNARDESESEYAERAYSSKKMQLGNVARQYGQNSQQAKDAANALARLEASYSAYKSPKAPTGVAVPGLRGQPPEGQVSTQPMSTQLPPMQTRPSAPQPDMSRTTPPMSDRFNPTKTAVNSAVAADRSARIARAETTRSGEGIMGAPMFSTSSTSQVQLQPSDIRPAGSAPSAPPARPVPQSMTSFTPDQAAEISAAQNTPAARRLRGEKVPPRTSNPLIRPGGQYEPM
jgi:hypothetical protein